MLSFKLQNYLATYKHIIGNAFQSNPKALGKLAVALDLYNQDKTRKVLNILTKLLKSCQNNQDFAVVYAFLGICHEECLYTELAISCYEQSIAYNDKISTVWSNLGLLHKNNGNFPKAMECFAKAIDVDASNAYPHYNLGALYYRLAENEKALSLCEKALQLQHNLYHSAEVICCIHLIENRVELYHRYYQIAIANGSNKQRLDTILEEYKKVFDN